MTPAQGAPLGGVRHLSSRDMPGIEHLVVLQPHLDDAALSCHALMAAARRVTVVAVFAGIPPAGTRPGRFDRLAGFSDPVETAAARRAEDAAALESRGIDVVHLDFLDAPYRSEPVSVDSLTAAVAETIAPDVTALAYPAALGSHPDHVLVSRLGSPVAWRHDGATPLAYADYPYASTYGWPWWVTGGSPDGTPLAVSEWAAPTARIAATGLRECVVVHLSPDDQVDKLAVLRRYRTQFDILEQGPSRVVSHPERLAYEVYWTG